MSEKFSSAIAKSVRLDPEQSGQIISAYQKAIELTGKPDPRAAWSMYAASRDSVNQNLHNLKEFREKTADIGQAIHELMASD